MLDGEAVPVRAQGMPRGDVLETLSPDPPPGSLMSGFWGMVPIGPHEPGQELELVLRARLEDGSEAVTPLGGIEIVEPAAPLELQPPEPSAGPFVAICMATHEPSLTLFRRQVDVDPRPDPSQLGLRGQRRLLVARSASPRSRRARATTRASSCPALPSGSASTANFERALSLAPAARRLRRARRPGRPLAPGQARDPASRRSATRSSCTATRASSTRTARCSRTPTGRSAATTTTTSPRC